MLFLCVVGTEYLDELIVSDSRESQNEGSITINITYN
jgi:hypothetical protein